MARSSRSVPLKLLDLPNEIISHITLFCARRDLQTLRQCNQQLSCLSEARLFSKVVLVPHKSSFARLEAISSHRLARHVRSLVYDPRTLLHDDHFSAWSAGNQENLMLTPDNIARLSNVLASLTKLEGIYVRSSDMALEPPAFYRQLCARTGGRMRLQAGFVEDTAAALFFAVANSQLRLQTLNVKDLRWKLFGESSRVPDSVLAFIFSNVSSLKLQFSLLSVPLLDNMPELLQQMYRLKQHVQVSPRLKNLSIRFCTKESWEDPLPLQLGFTPMFDFFFRSTFVAPCLESLHLDNYWTKAKVWLKFLGVVSPTLRTLKLGNVALLDYRTREGAWPAVEVEKTCWVAVLREMRRRVKLTTIDFEGTLAGGDGQRFITSSDEHARHFESQRTLKSSVIDWFLNGGPCPLEDAAKVTRYKPPQHGLPANMNGIGIGDTSWGVQWVEH